MGRSRKKQVLYERGVTALRQATGQNHRGYLCPICLREFVDLDQLTAEHVPPKSMRGKVICLTCSECNCRAGHIVDAHIEREYLSRSFPGTKGKPRRVRMSVDGISVNVDWTIREDHISLSVLKANDPQKVSVLQTQLPSIVASKGEIEIHDTVRWNRGLSDVGYLKSAYLAVFAKLGYRYILSKSLERVRQQIVQPKEKILRTVRIFSQTGDEAPNQILRIENPFRCIAVRMRDSLVMLPDFECRDDFYDKLDEMRARKVPMTTTPTGAMPWPTGLQCILDLGNHAAGH